MAVQLVAGMTDVRPFWEYRTFNKNYERNVEIFGKMALNQWLNNQWDMRWADAIRGCTTGGTSYLHQFWNESTQDIDLYAEDVRDVFPIRPGNDYSIQSCFGVLIRRERTINYLKRKYPEFAPYITADRDGSVTSMGGTRYEKLMEMLGSPFRNALWKNRKSETPRIPTADEFTLFLNDDSINKSKQTKYMGSWHLSPVQDCPLCLSQGTPHANTNWSYEVKPGEKYYPCKRLIVTTNNKVLYDNTSPYWHGLFPCPKLTLEPWRGSYIGKGLIWEIMSLNKFLNRTLRMVDNHFQKWQQPDLITDKNSTSVSEFNKINTARPGLKLRFNPAAGKGVEIKYPEQLPSYVFDMIKWSIETMGSISGAHDVSQMMGLNQMPSADSVERIMEAMTPEVRLRSRILEAFTREFAMITAFNISQFKTAQERLAILGPDGITPEDFDYDPGMLVPDYVHADDFGPRGLPTPEALLRGPMPRRNRTQEFMKSVSMHIAPGSLLSASEITDKLMYLTLARDGVIDPETLANKLGIPNYGTIPGKTVLEKQMFMAQMGAQQDPRQGRPPTAQEMPSAKPDSKNGSIKVSESG